MEERDMAALVRHDTAAEAAFSCADTEIRDTEIRDTKIRADAAEIDRLYDALDCVNERENPRTARLLSSGRSKIAQKVIEEAGEVALEAVRHRSRSVVRESADLVYQLVVLWHECGIAPDEVWAEMRRRADRLGIAEKLPKGSGCDASAIGFGK
jgi:phosphoribosyl-ATP pyrophosphohydrolase